jgi:hypothetical protein
MIPIICGCYVGKLGTRGIREKKLQKIDSVSERQDEESLNISRSVEVHDSSDQP